MKYYYHLEKNKTYASIVDEGEEYQRRYYSFIPSRYVLVDTKIEIQNPSIIKLIEGDKLRTNFTLNQILISTDFVREIRRINIPSKKNKNKYPF